MLPRNCGAFFMPVSKGAKRTGEEKRGTMLYRITIGGGTGNGGGLLLSWFLIHFFKLIFSGSINKISKKDKKIAQVKTCAYICKK